MTAARPARTLAEGAPAGDRPYVLCEDLFKIYKSEDLEVVALRGLDLRVARGEMMAIIGASGSGKSTLLNVLAGLDTPSAGRVSVGGRDLLRIAEEELVAYRRTEVGFVWQQTGRNLIPYLSAQQNVEVPQMVNGASRAVASERARSLLERVGMGARTRNKPHELSGGEQQRVAIAVALANDPPLLLGDEPTGELDEATTAEVFEVLRELNEETGVTIVIVTHDPAVIERVDRVVAMRDGRASSELVRQLNFAGDGAGPVEEFAVVDRSGRLQIPRQFVEQLGLGARARLELVGGHVEVRSEADEAPLRGPLPGSRLAHERGANTAAATPVEPPGEPAPGRRGKPEAADEAKGPEAPATADTADPAPPEESPWRRPS